MQTGSMMRAVAGAAAVVFFAGAAQAALQDRDMNGDSVVDAFYDTDLDITWLRDANVNGSMSWADAVAWADGFSIGGYSDWRLPTSDQCAGANCTNSEMGHLWYVELGNVALDLTPNRGAFENFLGNYWSGTELASSGVINAVFFNSNSGLQGGLRKTFEINAMAVRDGDVTPIPEPQTNALMLLGLGAGALIMRRRSR